MMHDMNSILRLGVFVALSACGASSGDHAPATAATVTLVEPASTPVTIAWELKLHADDPARPKTRVTVVAHGATPDRIEGGELFGECNPVAGSNPWLAAENPLLTLACGYAGNFQNIGVFRVANTLVLEAQPAIDEDGKPPPAPHVLGQPSVIPANAAISTAPTISSAPTPATDNAIASAGGPKGTTRIVACTQGVGMLVTSSGKTKAAHLNFASVPSADQVGFVDVDQDGLPDAIIARGSGNGASPLVSYSVFRSGLLVDDPKATPCSGQLSRDPGSDAYLIGVTTIGAAAAALRAVPARGVSQKEVCALIDGSGFSAPKDQYTFGDGDLVGRTHSKTAVISCAKRVADGPKSFLVPTFQCDAFRPYCSFGLMSGDTSVPPSERKYWFDWKGSKLTMIAVAVPQ